LAARRAEFDINVICVHNAFMSRANRNPPPGALFFVQV
jgi:hypothetical protein